MTLMRVNQNSDLNDTKKLNRAEGNCRVWWWFSFITTSDPFHLQVVMWCIVNKKILILSALSELQTTTYCTILFCGIMHWLIHQGNGKWSILSQMRSLPQGYQLKPQLCVKNFDVIQNSIQLLHQLRTHFVLGNVLPHLYKYHCTTLGTGDGKSTQRNGTCRNLLSSESWLTFPSINTELIRHAVTVQQSQGTVSVFSLRARNTDKQNCVC